MTDTLALCIWANRVLAAALTPRMSQLFGSDCKQFFSDALGFDIVEFDDVFFGADNDQTLHENVLKNFGQEGVALVRKAILQEPLTAEEKASVLANKHINAFHVELYEERFRYAEEYRKKVQA